MNDAQNTSHDDPNAEQSDSAAAAPAKAVGGVKTFARSAVGGVLMGMANVVPGVSGGTMLLAAGIYPKFIEAIAEVSTLRFRKSSLSVLIVVVLFAVAAIALAARVIRPLVIDQRWIMYSLFIGLTLGGVPILWRMLRPALPRTWVAAAVGFIGMALLAVAQAKGWGAGDGETATWSMMFIAGVAGASAMILPGISGAYLLLVLQVYLPILTAIDQVRTALSDRDFEAMIHPTLSVILPVGLGVVVGVVVFSNLIKFLLHRVRNVTLGLLLGLLVGAVVGLWPFQRIVKPAEGDIIRGQVMTAETISALDPEKYPTQFFTPSATQVLISLLLIAVGFAITAALARLGRDDEAKVDVQNPG